MRKIKYFLSLAQEGLSKVQYSKNILENSLPSLSFLNPYFKSSGFKEEKEWRIVYQSYKNFIWLGMKSPLISKLNEINSWRKELFLQNTIGKKISFEENNLLGNVKFMTRNRNIVAYYDLPFTYDDKEVLVNPVQHIILGPKCKIDQGYILFFLENNGFDISKVKVSNSKTSYK